MGKDKETEGGKEQERETCGREHRSFSFGVCRREEGFGMRAEPSNMIGMNRT